MPKQSDNSLYPKVVFVEQSGSDLLATRKAVDMLTDDENQISIGRYHLDRMVTVRRESKVVVSNTRKKKRKSRN